MGVMLQAFFWDCPRVDNREFQWWEYVCQQVPSLAKVGFTSLWLPPVHKAANLSGPSMGYDPYDYYDLGEFDQKGTIPSWFGTKSQLLDLIQTAHHHGLSLIADVVINHNSGADAQEINPIIGQPRWTLFNPMSERFPRTWECFHPCMYESWDEMTFGDMPDLSHRNPYVYAELLELARWLIEEVGFDGFRYDFVKGYGANTIAAFQEYRYMRDGRPLRLRIKELETLLSERDAMVDQLSRSEEKYRTVADFTYDWEWWKDPEGRYLYVSPSCERVTGYRPEDFFADPDLIIKISHPDDRPAVNRHFNSLLQNGAEVYHLDYRIILRGGDVRWISHYCQPINDKQGKYLGPPGEQQGYYRT